MAAKAGKKSVLARSGSATAKEAASIAASLDKKGGLPRFTIWPEWSDADINAEKWGDEKGTKSKTIAKDKKEVAQKGGKGEKGKSPVTQHFFDDPEGRPELPLSLNVNHWKRPSEFLLDKMPTVVDIEAQPNVDFMKNSEYAHESELMRFITSQISSLWKCGRTKMTTESMEPGIPVDGEYYYAWRPWELIYAINKPSKGPNIPAYNQHGKYVVKLYYMGCWRKIIVDDQVPFDDDDHMLFPCSNLEYELWPMILTKALLKIASLDYDGGDAASEIGDFSVVQCLTGWLPEEIPLQYSHKDKVWDLLKSSLPNYVQPTRELPKTPVKEEVHDLPQEKVDPEKAEIKTKDTSKDGKGKGKDGKDDKRKDKDKDKDKGKKDKEKEEKTIVQEEYVLPEKPEFEVFAKYQLGPPKDNIQVSLLAEMANASESLRQAGLSHLHTHSMHINQVRDCTLEAPPPPEIIPRWKLIRPKKKLVTPSDEPIVTPVEKPIKCLELSSIFINYKVSPIPVPNEMSKMLKEYGQQIRSTDIDIHRSRTAQSVRSLVTPVTIEERDDETEVENADENEQQVEAEKKDDSKPEEQQSEELMLPLSPELVGDKNKKKKSKGSAKTKDEKPVEKDAVVKDLKPPKVKDAKPESIKSSEPSKPKGSAVPSNLDTQGAAEEQSAHNTDVCALESPGPESSAIQAVEHKDTKIWMDMDIFNTCFSSIILHHKAHTYPHNYKYSDLKGDKTNSTSSDEKAPHYLFVDNLKQSEILVSFSAVWKWHDPQATAAKEEARLRNKNRDSKTDDAAGIEETLDKSEEKTKPPSGSLLAEPYTWKSLVTGQPMLRLRTTGSSSAMMILPEGRHVLRFYMQAPLGYHVHISSSTPFIFGDEEKVMSELVKESCRFIEHALTMMKSLGDLIMNFKNPETFKTLSEVFFNSHCPYKDKKNMSKQKHHFLITEAFYSVLRKTLAEAQLATPEIAFAWRAFFNDATNKNILNLPSPSSRPATGVNVERSSAKTKPSKRQRESKTPTQENLGDTQAAETKVDWSNREITPDEHVAAVKIQKYQRGSWVRKLLAARTPGTEENAKTQERLMKCWTVMEPNAKQLGLAVFRSLFKAEPELMPHYPFYKDEWNKIEYADYQGMYPDQPNDTWFLVFREVFHVTEEMLCVPKLYIPIPTCLLRVVDNDTGLELPKVFQKVAPYVYKKNKKGYTFVAEALTTDSPVPSGRWRMRLIGGLSPLPAPSKNEVNSSFNTREIRDYYLPNDKYIIFRYTVKCLDDHLASIQVSTSKSDVYVHLAVLDQEEEILSAVGKGHVVLPAVSFEAEGISETEVIEESAAKRNSSRAASVTKGKTSKGKRSGSQEDRLSRQSTRTSEHSNDNDESSVKSSESSPRASPFELKHKYIIQATVLRQSWPLSQASWAFVQHLKEQEKMETKVSHKESTSSAPEKSSANNASLKAKDKSKGKSSKGQEKGEKNASRPPSSQFDISKPHWTLRFVSDGHAAENVEIKKDTERVDDIRAMKKAWEDAEPGRAAKAMQSRLQYLKANTIKVQKENKPGSVTDEQEQEQSDMSQEQAPLEQRPSSGLTQIAVTDLDDTILTNFPPPPATPTERLQPVDLAPFLKQDGPLRIKDAEEEARQLAARQQEIAKYREQRQLVLEWRKQDKVKRNAAKIHQLQQAEALQAAVDAAREAVHKPREIYRQKFLEAERLRQEELAAAEAAAVAELAKNNPSPKSKRSAKGKKGKK